MTVWESPDSNRPGAALAPKPADLALMVYDSEDVEEAQLCGPGPCIHHWGIEVENRDSYVAKIKANGGIIISASGEGALKFRAPDRTVAQLLAIQQLGDGFEER